ncbi:hypothetical protein C9374_012559 [Naegleria lovaniensis]|uniref:Glycosyltransferase 61 catalytic domain-containing protein n=1 Tax=Naegleria lovaniensis TaxID=51637 RepID=A0AA88H369_NAELO|nr:uncharacterized protein C9374_012559 [Naegleria lovaniensis]KAG2392307.1 hypothetical protein C9374_012559 [Naegleria lovaniensis]
MKRTTNSTNNFRAQDSAEDNDRMHASCHHGEHHDEEESNRLLPTHTKTTQKLHSPSTSSASSIFHHAFTTSTIPAGMTGRTLSTTTSATASTTSHISAHSSSNTTSSCLDVVTADETSRRQHHDNIVLSLEQAIVNNNDDDDGNDEEPLLSPTSSTSSISGVDLVLDACLQCCSGCCDHPSSLSTTTTSNSTTCSSFLLSYIFLIIPKQFVYLKYLFGNTSGASTSPMITGHQQRCQSMSSSSSSYFKDKPLAWCMVGSLLCLLVWSVYLLKVMREFHTEAPPGVASLKNAATRKPQKQPFTNYDQYYLQDDGMEYEKTSLQSHSGLFCTHHVKSAHFRSCLVYNLCYRNGTYLYFNSKDVTTHYPVEFDLQGLETKRLNGLFDLVSLEGRTKSEDAQRGKLIVHALSQSIQEYQQEHSISNIHWVTKRSVLLKRHRCSNAAHCLFETIYPTFALLKEFFDIHPLKNIKKFVNNYLIFAEQEDEECDCEKDMLTCGTEEGESKKKQKLCKKFVTQYGKIISKHSNKLIREFTKEHDLVCWKSVVMGGSSYGLFNDHGWHNVGGMVKEFRDFTYARFRTAMRTPKQILFQEKVLNVRINVKTGMRTYLRNILHADKLVELAKRDFKTFYHKKSNTVFKVDFQTFVFDNMTIEEKVQYMQDTDVFIAPFGSASYESVFLSSGAVLFTFPDGFPPNRIQNRITDHTLFHSYMHYQNIIYPIEASELEYEKGIDIGHYSWSWHKTRLLIARSLNMRLDYLFAVLPSYAMKGQSRSTVPPLSSGR